MAKRSKVDSGVQSIIGGGFGESRKKSVDKNKPVATRLEFSDDERLQVVADEMGVKKAEVVKLAILKFLNSWDDGYRPSKKKKVVEEWEI